MNKSIKCTQLSIFKDIESLTEFIDINFISVVDLLNHNVTSLFLVVDSFTLRGISDSDLDLGSGSSLNFCVFLCVRFLDLWIVFDICVLNI